MLSLSPLYVSWAPWQWIGRLPLLQNVRAVPDHDLRAARRRRRDRAGRGRPRALRALRASRRGGGVLALVDRARGHPGRPEPAAAHRHVAVPAWWRAAQGPGVVARLPVPRRPAAGHRSPGRRRRPSPSRCSAGAARKGRLVERAPAPRRRRPHAVLDAFDRHRRDGRTAPARPRRPQRRARPLDGRRDGVTEVVVPVALHGRFLATGAPRAPAARLLHRGARRRPRRRSDDAWVFAVPGPLADPRHVSVATCARRAPRAGEARPASLAPVRPRAAPSVTRRAADARPTTRGPRSRPSTRASVRDALVVAVAGLVANGLNLIVTIVLARVLPSARPQRRLRGVRPDGRALPRRLAPGLGDRHRGRAALVVVARSVGGNAQLEAWRRQCRSPDGARPRGLRRRRGARRAVRREAASAGAAGSRSSSPSLAAGCWVVDRRRARVPPDLSRRYQPLAANFLLEGLRAHRGGARRGGDRGRHRGGRRHPRRRARDAGRTPAWAASRRGRPTAAARRGARRRVASSAVTSPRRSPRSRCSPSCSTPTSSWSAG